MKILVATSSHQPNDDRIYDKQIRFLLEKGHEVVLVTRNQGPFNPGTEGFRHVDTPSANLKAFGETLEDLARSWQPDIFMIHEFVLLLAGSRIKRKLDIPLVYDVHESHRELWDLTSSKRFPVKQLINWGLDRFERNFLKYVDRVLTVSPFIEERYRQWGRMTTLIPNFPRLRPDAGTKRRDPVVIYEGQISIKRGLVPLIRAFAGVLDVRPDARLEIVGPEHLPGTGEQLQAHLERMGIQGNVTIDGPIPHQAILNRLTKAQIGVIPFPDHPAFHAAVPIKLFEYMLCGCAVVTSDLRQIRRYAGDVALLIPPGDVESLREALIRLLTNQNEREDRSRRGREQVEAVYNWQQVEPLFLKTLESLA